MNSCSRTPAACTRTATGHIRKTGAASHGLRTVNALKRICKDTAGSKVEIAIEAVNTESVNNPWAHKRLREDVGDPRITVGLDITNMVHPGVAFRMTELINTTFDLLGDQIRYVHAKDFVWNTMLPGINWAMNGTGNMDYEMFLVRLSRLKTNPTCWWSS